MGTLAHPDIAADPETAIAYWAAGCKHLVECMDNEDACDEDILAQIAANDDPEDGLCQDSEYPLGCLYMEISCPWVWAVLDAVAEKEKNMDQKKKAAAVKKLLRGLKL